MSDTETTTTETKQRPRGVGTAIREQLAAGATNDQAFDAVKAEFPDSKTTRATVSWYRNDMRAKHAANPAEHPAVPTAHEANQAHKPAAAPAETAPEGDPLA